MFILTIATLLNSLKMENSSNKPYLIKGGLAVDERGCVSFANGFDFKSVKRFYLAENVSTDTIRAFHGHLKEAKYVLVVSGAALVVAIEIDHPQAPSKDKEPQRFVLSAKNPAVLYIPAGYANGFRALEQGTKVMFFSDKTLEESEGDAFRFPFDYWGRDVWGVKNF